MSGRTPVERFGAYGRRVNVFRTTLRGESVVRVEWRERDATGRPIRRTETFRGPKREAERAAKAFGEGVAQRLAGGAAAATAARRTVDELWAAYLLAHEVDWRPKTAALARARWKPWSKKAGPRTYADLISPETLDEFRAHLLTVPRRKTGRPMAKNQVAHHIQLVKSVWRWGAMRRLIPWNPLEGYAVRRGRDYAPLAVDEFSPDECAAILGALSARDPKQWRPWVAVVLAAVLAPRSNALLHLTWDAVDLEARTVTWDAAHDKLGRRRVQPLPRDAVWALRVAAVWRRRLGVTSPYVLPGANKRTAEAGRPWTYQALNKALHNAADRAGVPWKPYRAMHAFRRMAAKTVLAATGDLELAGRWLGDTDLRVLKRSYLRDRADDLTPAADAVALQRRNTTGNETATARREGRAVATPNPLGGNE